jgi:hypothetical protein
VFLDQAVATELLEAFKHCVHRRSYLLRTGLGKIVQEAPPELGPHGCGLGRLGVPLGHPRQDRPELSQRVSSSELPRTLAAGCRANDTRAVWTSHPSPTASTSVEPSL